MPLLVAAFLIAGLLVACDRSAPPPVDRLVLAAGSAHDAVARALADVINDRWHIPVEVHPTGGSVDNLSQVDDGQADLGFATLDVTHLATQGDTPFEAAQAVAPLAALYDDYLHVVVPDPSPVRTLADLAGRRVSLGSAASGTPVIAERVLATAGVRVTEHSWLHLDTAQAADRLALGTIDAFFVTGGRPTPAVADLARRRPIRLLPVTDDTGRLRDESGQYYHERFVTAGVYGLDAEVATVGVATVVVVPRSMPDAVADALTAVLFDAQPRLVDAHAEARALDARSAIAVAPLVLHPGAIAYYRRTKPLA